jgi:AraC-like DNA-binding protein
MTYDRTAAEAKESSLSGGQLSLTDRIARWTVGRNRLDTSIRGLSLHRWETPTEPESYMLAPSICLIGQGRKRLFLGEEPYVYNAHRFLRVIAKLILSQVMTSVRPPKERLGIAVSEVSAHLLDAFNRLIDLLEHPEDIPALGSLTKQEIFYRLLTGEQGPRLRQITTVGNHAYQISRAIDWLKDNFNKPLRIEELANKVGLSTSAFHNHFRSTTAMSPLQFQKRMRLNEARRLMLTERLDASKAAFEVGYESPSQFSREYSRLFGMPPMRDIKSLIEVSTG